jgi:hypothetical protein
MLMLFFPGRVEVHPGDTVQWMVTNHDDAPHTVRFLNGEAEPPLATPANVALYVGAGPLPYICPVASTSRRRVQARRRRCPPHEAQARRRDGERDRTRRRA